MNSVPVRKKRKQAKRLELGTYELGTWTYAYDRLANTMPDQLTKF